MKTQKRRSWLIAVFAFSAMSLMAQSNPLAEGVAAVAQVAGETRTPETPADTTTAQTVEVPVKPVPLWKQKLYYGYNFDIYFHHDSRTNRKENGWSIAVEPEIGWKLKERLYLGMRFGGGYQDLYTTFTIAKDDGTKVSEDLRVQQGTWNVTPYVRYRLKSMFNDKVGIWIEAHLYTGMEFPRVVSDGVKTGTDYDGLKHSITYGAQVSPVITYKFNRKSTFQVFFSILSFGYSGTAFRYVDDPTTGAGHMEYTNDLIIFSGKLRNLIANHFTPGLYGLKFGVQKSF